MPNTVTESCLAAHQLRCLRGDRELFNDLSLSLNSGELLQIHGANGSGKTTLLRMLCGMVLPDAGEIYWQGTATHQNRASFLQNLHYIGHLTGIKPELSPLENLEFVTRVRNNSLQTSLEAALERVELYGFEHEQARTLSAGQKRRITLARLLVSPAKLWVLDEPFNALDKSGIALLEALLHEHLQKEGMIILASHMPINLHNQHKTLHLRT